MNNNGKNQSAAPDDVSNTVISLALTLTTGCKYAGKINRAKPYYLLLTKLLQSYKNMYSECMFKVEIFNKGFQETPLHFHGWIKVYPSKMYLYSSFIREWLKQTKTHQVVSKVMFDQAKWQAYMDKHDVINATYEACKLPRTVKSDNLARLRKWSSPKDTTQKDILSFLGVKGGGGEELSDSEEEL